MDQATVCSLGRRALQKRTLHVEGIYQHGEVHVQATTACVERLEGGLPMI